MMPDPPRGVIRFGGYPNMWFIADCRHCDIWVAFRTLARRLEWSGIHAVMPGHGPSDIEYATDVQTDDYVQIGGCDPVVP